MTLFSKSRQIKLVFAIVLTFLQAQANAQIAPQYTEPTWWYGVAGGVNVNFYRGSTQKLDDNFTAPVPFTSGTGVGLYVAPLVEYHFVDSRFGIMLQAGYDNRAGTYKEVLAPCGCPRDLSTNLSYITVEPSVRFAPFKSDLYLFAGPRVAFEVDNSYIYKQKPNPESQNQASTPDMKGNLSDMNKVQVSMQIGAGYDIHLSSKGKQNQFILSPFVSFQPYFGQQPRSIETWNVTTLRAGIAFKFGRGKIVPVGAAIPVAEPKVEVSVAVPTIIPAERKVREMFPLRNYVFFDLGSNIIPDRYMLLKKDQVKDFKEEQVEMFAPKNMSGRSPRQMTVYYNILNILGDRLGKNPSSNINLVGSSESGPLDGQAMAESVKHYLVSVFGIAGARIKTEGRDKPKIPSEKPNGTKELAMLREGDRRVSIESSAPSMLMEFQSGPDAPLKPVEITALEEAPVESYISFSAGKGNDSFASWTMEIKGEHGKAMHYGPYYQENISIPGKSILGTHAEGNYKVTITGTTKRGNTVKNDTTVHLVLWTPPTSEEVMRFSVIYEFNDAKAIGIYEKYLTDVVTPKIPKGGKVIIHGYTDIIGDEAYNRKLSLDRANDVLSIMKASLTKTGRTDVTFSLRGYGADETLAPFRNGQPEERAYNRTVLIDIIPAKQ